ncbi:hypothetical protein DVH24_037943 [Malus domestica]|uniref:Uncharacterized protein n=1 Tax=Malus domestica TaxID=3750 RepID=A0A498K367_MALDO|nr:hypothetical protein DVH24_037943 [Malus domestica]
MAVVNLEKSVTLLKVCNVLDLGYESYTLFCNLTLFSEITRRASSVDVSFTPNHLSPPMLLFGTFVSIRFHLCIKLQQMDGCMQIMCITDAIWRLGNLWLSNQNVLAPLTACIIYERCRETSFHYLFLHVEKVFWAGTIISDIVLDKQHEI